jgi:hypothetical protein
MQDGWEEGGASEQSCMLRENGLNIGSFSNTKAEIWRHLSQKLGILREKQDHISCSNFV